ncbi:BON domain-containing protein [Bizionia gelidisalsuginis]|uniref:BON domain-containing protein n=1 Tax=Bizionia gelidisalsuginis TaxID=291188 RepID=A0ABY3M8K6_9FLAO|nr:BON domain-containing protein [Bizionia gelidisalsuginis]TYC10573.1 BON domain-containing protein [Bizionia gelidisalsuginis]
MKTDIAIKEDVLEELNWLPNIDETQIGVIVKDGVVTLTGTVSDYPKKGIIDRAIKRINGVKAVAEEIKVKYGDRDKYSDEGIAKAAVNALEWNASVPSEHIIINVENGTVHLTGELEWAFQKEFAKRTIEHLLGVKEVINNIQLKPKATPANVEVTIKKAFERSAIIDAKNINVTINGNTATLTGTVHSIQEKDNALRAAYLADGITDVKNKIEVAYDAIYL